MKNVHRDRIPSSKHAMLAYISSISPMLSSTGIAFHNLDLRLELTILRSAISRIVFIVIVIITIIVVTSSTRVGKNKSAINNVVNYLIHITI